MRWLLVKKRILTIVAKLSRGGLGPHNSWKSRHGRAQELRAYIWASTWPKLEEVGIEHLAARR